MKSKGILCFCLRRATSLKNTDFIFRIASVKRLQQKKTTAMENYPGILHISKQNGIELKSKKINL